jgi:nucleoid-associated protein YgaU
VAEAAPQVETPPAAAEAAPSSAAPAPMAEAAPSSAAPAPMAEAAPQVETRSPTAEATPPSEAPAPRVETPPAAAQVAPRSDAPAPSAVARPTIAVVEQPTATEAPAEPGSAPVPDHGRPGPAEAAASPTQAEAATAGAADLADRGEAAEIEPGAAPSFDIVRIAPGGRAVVAGRAAPEAEVELRSGDRVIDRVRADRRGEWVAVPPEPLPAGDQELTLAARIGDRPAVESDEVLVVAVREPAPGGPAPEVVAAEPPSTALAVALPKQGRGQGRILQAPGRISGDGTLALVMLDYDDAGRIRLHGEASPGAPVLIYVDNEPAGTAVVEPSGQWSAVLEPTLAPGDYTLRLDQLDASGKPSARLETPFARASQPPVEGDVQVDFVVVQPGNSLWRIARRLYGQGVEYVHIYDANQSQIRDPDLIYPGQVFEIPKDLDTTG